jgi:hypothetical protein
MVAGIIVSAAADEKVLADPAAAASTASAWMILGGPALFLAGHAAFKLVVWRALSWPRVAGIAVLALLALAARAIPDLALATCAAAVVAAVAAADRLPRFRHPPPEYNPASTVSLRELRGWRERRRGGLAPPAPQELPGSLAGPGERAAWVIKRLEDDPGNGGAHRGQHLLRGGVGR